MLVHGVLHVEFQNSQSSLSHLLSCMSYPKKNLKIVHHVVQLFNNFKLTTIQEICHLLINSLVPSMSIGLMWCGKIIVHPHYSNHATEPCTVPRKGVPLTPTHHLFTWEQRFVLWACLPACLPASRALSKMSAVLYLLALPAKARILCLDSL